MSFLTRLLLGEGKAAETPIGAKAPIQQLDPNPNATAVNQWYVSFNGEKSFGEMGPVINYSVDYQNLAARSWQAYLESDITKTVLKKLGLWVIAEGLNLQAMPIRDLIKEYTGNEINAQELSQKIEVRFRLWARSKRASMSGEEDLNDIALEAYKHCEIGGDVLVVQRLDETNNIRIQLYDTACLSSNIYNPHTTGNNVYHGVEYDDSGKHLGYHIKVRGVGSDFIPAYTNGMRTAFLVYGDRYRAGDMRGIPAMTTSLETVKKLERYKEAAVGSAEERAKIVYQIVSEKDTAGMSPFTGQLANLYDADSGGTQTQPTDDVGQKLAGSVKATSNKETYLMMPGQELKSLESKQEMFFNEFYNTNANHLCAAIGIPPNVAFSMYNDSFSASRAATKDWEHTITVKRAKFCSQFYQRIYEFWFHVKVLTNKISAPGYMEAYGRDWDVVESYVNSRFTGPMFPHIDPLKEAKAEREKLGELGRYMPLTTLERATEFLGGGEASHNIEQFAEELKLMEKSGLEIKDEKPVVNQTSNGLDDVPAE
jgi:capsid protein